MSAPNVPQDFKELISTPASSLCSNFVSTLLKLPTLLYAFMNWLLDTNGNFTKAAINQIQPAGTYEYAAFMLPEDGTRLLCDGREVPQATYPDLYTNIGLTYGTPANGANFKIPDFRGTFPVGIGSSTDTVNGTMTFNVGVPYGEHKHTLVSSECGLPDHTHDAQSQTATGGLTGAANAFSDGPGPTAGITGGPVDASVAHNNIPFSRGQYIFIRC